MKTMCITAGIVGALLLSGVAQAELYRWVDEDGEVHYSDRLPPERAPEERRVFSRDGDTLRDVDRMPTAEELEALEEARKAAEDAQQREQEQHRLQAEYDEMLQRSYTSVEDLERSRERRIQPLQTRLDNAERRRQRLDNRIDELRESAAEAERGQRDVAPYERRLRQARQLREREDERIRQRQEEIDTVNTEFDRHLERFRILLGESR
ncbi:DUF4124 domain-containing protein [Methylonatrum kenyense]|uniref:DUF4124 domain-containing protein n=1 Tax=Methylonatrum kenyense TaxID=455253 RepID=UPI0020BEBC40|nr:DUF4124 domain-containing protein [Methylonatrum kenyense]MCK8515505.1 DUF4124 domain-containing protein [Methylonatrum kenyense]